MKTHKVKPVKAWAVVDCDFGPNVRKCKPQGESSTLYSTTFFRVFPTYKDAKTWKLLDTDSIVKVLITPLVGREKK